MTKISKKSAYPIKKPVKKDYFVGTDIESNLKTVNFEFEDVALVINEINGDQLIDYVFRTSYNIPLDALTEGNFLSKDNQTTISAITELYINRNTKSEVDLVELYDFLKINATGFYFKLQSATNPNAFVYFNITSIDSYPDTYTFHVTLYKANAALVSLADFGEYLFSFGLKSSSGSSVTNTSELINDGENGTDTYVESATVEALDDRVVVLENLQNLHTNLTGQAYVVWSGVGLIFDVIYPNYYIQGVLYPGAVVQRTLTDADPSDPRQDVIILDTTGPVVKTGVASPDPPAYIVDSETEIYLTTILVAAGATTPSGFSEKVVYKENIEFTTFTNSGAINFNATASPFQGTTHIDCTGFTAGHTMKFTEVPLSAITDFSNINYRVSLKAVFSNSARFYVRFLKNGIVVSSTVEVISGNYNFNRNTVNMYQQIVIPTTAFSFSNGQINGVEIFMYGSNASGFRMDNVILSTGGSAPSPLQKSIVSIVTDSGVVNATVADDTIEMRSANNGLLISAVGKIITFTSLFTSTLKGLYDTAYTWVNTNGTTVMTHLSRMDNPHNVTAAQVGSPSGSGTSTGTNTGDETTASLKTKIDIEYSLACSDETSDLTIGTLITFRIPFAMTLSAVRLSVNTAPTLSAVIVDVKESGTSIFSTLLSIDATEKTSVTAAVPAVISDVNLADDAELTVITTQIGSVVKGNGLKITFIGKKV